MGVEQKERKREGPLSKRTHTYAMPNTRPPTSVAMLPMVNSTAVGRPVAAASTLPPSATFAGGVINGGDVGGADTS